MCNYNNKPQGINEKERNALNKINMFNYYSTAVELLLKAFCANAINSAF